MKVLEEGPQGLLGDRREGLAQGSEIPGLGEKEINPAGGAF